LLTDSENTSNSYEKLNVLRFYQKYGYLYGKFDPLEIHNSTNKPNSYDEMLKNIDSSIFDSLNPENCSLEEFTVLIDRIFGNKMGFIYDHIISSSEKEFFEKNIVSLSEKDLSVDDKKCCLKYLVQTVKFEEFLHKKFPTVKRFGVQGCESSIMCINQIIETAKQNFDVSDFILGASHRGRVSIMANVVQIPLEDIMKKFKGFADKEEVGFRDDVKYHYGCSNQNIQLFNGKKVRTTLLSNPSHLESIVGAVYGYTHALQIKSNYSSGPALGIICHGDASFCGQGVVYESLQFSNLKNNSGKGLIHIIINNNVGFTANPGEIKSMPTASSLSKAFDIPAIRVNANCVKSIVKAANIAVEYRQKFQKDCIIEIIGYRKYGHNELDEPSMTQPEEYKVISSENEPKVLAQAEKDFCEGNEDMQNYFKEVSTEFNEKLEKALSSVEKGQTLTSQNWKVIIDEKLSVPKEIHLPKVSKVKLANYIKQPLEIIQANNINPHKGIKRSFDNKISAFNKSGMIDWSTAEFLSYFSILDAGIDIRLSGQDVKRGTFSHRHSYITNQNHPYQQVSIFDNITKNSGANYTGINTILSEFATIGFEYGYSICHPNSLTIWEAQFGDFANNAQTMIDNYLSACYGKWKQECGLVLQLPHGYEGQGSEHSSARIERFLQLSNDASESEKSSNDIRDSFESINMHICSLSSPSNLYHLLRRQVQLSPKRPLILLTPKSMLRNPEAVSKLRVHFWILSTNYLPSIRL